MCCVMPPASVSTTCDFRIASSSVVLPWSTWPMIVTTGGRVTSASSGSSKVSGSSSSAACLIVTSRFSSAAISSTSSSVSDWVAVFGTPSPIRIVMMFGIETPSACERSRTLTPDSTAAGPVGATGAWRGSRRWPSCWPRAWRGSCRGRAAWLSMTTRRLRLPGPPPPRGRSGRFGLLPPLAISSPQCKDAPVPDRPGPPVAAPARSPVAPAPVRSRRGGHRCTHLARSPRVPRRARRRARRSARARAGARGGRSRRSAGPALPLLLRPRCLLHRNARRHVRRLGLLGLRRRQRLLRVRDLRLRHGRRRVGDRRLVARSGRLRRGLRGRGRGRRLRRLAADVVGARACERLVRRHAAEAGAGQGGVRAPLAVGQDRRAPAGQLLFVAAAAEGDLGLGPRELRVGLDVDLPAREPGREAGVHALLANRERELVVRDDDGRLLRVVVEVDLAHARRGQRLRHEARRLGIPRDDVDLLAAQLRDDHAHARAARADAGADRVDALGVRLDGDLRAVAGLAGDAADDDEPVGDLRHLELEERLDQLRIAAGEDHLRALRARADLRDDGLDARALLVALAVDLLGARQQRLDLAQVDEHVVPVAGLLDDPRHYLADTVDVLVVHHPPLLLADPLEDHLLGGLRGDAAEAGRRHVLALNLALGNLGPVDVEVVVGDEGVLSLAGLLLEALELLELALAGVVEEALLDLDGQFDREDAEVAAVVHLDGGVPGGARSLLVGGEQRVLERRDERSLLDALVALDLANSFDDLLAHLTPSRRSGCPARSTRTEYPRGRRR